MSTRSEQSRIRTMSRFLAFSGVLVAGGARTAKASSQGPQTWLPGECIPHFETALPVFGPGANAALPRVDALKHPLLKVKMKEASRPVLPTTGSYTNSYGTGNVCPAVNIQPTTIWAYETSD